MGKGVLEVVVLPLPLLLLGATFVVLLGDKLLLIEVHPLGEVGGSHVVILGVLVPLRFPDGVGSL